MLEEIKFDNKNNRQRANENRNDRSILNETGVEKKKGANMHEYEQLSEKAVDLIFNNKINAKNAFDVNVDYLDKLPNLLKKNEETSWQKASASLDASAKIYGYRVDSVHSDTFKFLGGLSRAEKEGEGQEEGGDEEKKEKRNREGRHDGFSTLEKDPRKLDLLKYDLEFEVDPLFKLMTAKFGDSGARGLLLKTLPIDTNIDVLLESKDEKIQNNKNEKNLNNAKNQNFKIVKKENEKNIMIIDEDPEGENLTLSQEEDNSVSTDLRSIIEKTLTSFSIQELKSTQICPDLSYFKKIRDLETSLERTFYQNLMQEFDETMVRENILFDKSQVSELDNSMHFAENENIENENLENYSSMSHRSSHDSYLSAKFDDNLNMIGNLNSSRNEFSKMMGVAGGNNMGISYMEGFSYLKSDDIKEYIHQFGDGNKEIFKNVPQYKNFTKSFNQLEKFNNFTGGNIFGGATNNNNENKKRVKKEETLFEFNEDNEVKKNEIFEKDSKAKKVIIPKEATRKRIKKKVKQFYHYDRSVLFNLFSIKDRLINREEGGDNLIQNNDHDNNDVFSQPGDGDGDRDGLPLVEEEKSNIIESFIKIDSEYEKNSEDFIKRLMLESLKVKSGSLSPPSLVIIS